MYGEIERNLGLRGTSGSYYIWSTFDLVVFNMFKVILGSCSAPAIFLKVRIPNSFPTKLLLIFLVHTIIVSWNLKFKEKKKLEKFFEI